MIRHIIRGIVLTAIPVFVFGQIGLTPRGWTAAVFFLLVGAAAFYDIDTKQIPDGLTAAVAAAGAFAFCLFPETAWWDRLLGTVCVSVLMLAVTLCREDAFGGGDIKLAAACGLFLGAARSLMAFGLATAAGSIYGLVRIAAGRANRRMRIALGPFLGVGVFVAFWYF
ncbi:MAG: prepilin peptidase [Lachnospiraceae bacterium]|jgi:leader peptidase (prepilin peptidase)/N-methyltransferase|nr:prepilin peptidase [Lachnospiraceae bacterium]